MTSLTFCVGGPAGGGGAPGVAEPAAMLRSMCTTSLLWAPASPRLSDQPDAANRGWCLRARARRCQSCPSGTRKSVKLDPEILARVAVRRYRNSERVMSFFGSSSQKVLSIIITARSPSAHSLPLPLLVFLRPLIYVPMNAR
jgi:hypothetical protein